MSGASIVNEMAVEIGLNFVRGICTLLTSLVPCRVNKASRIGLEIKSREIN